MSKDKSVSTWVGLAAAGFTLGALAVYWWSRRAEPPLAQRETDDELRKRARFDALEAIDDLPPDSSVFDAAPVSDGQVTARPHATAHLPRSADDDEAIGADELGAAFLARATDTSGQDEEPSSLEGFRIVEPR